MLQVPAYVISQADQEPLGQGRSSICGHLLLASGRSSLRILRRVSFSWHLQAKHRQQLLEKSDSSKL